MNPGSVYVCARCGDHIRNDNDMDMEEMIHTDLSIQDIKDAGGRMAKSTKKVLKSIKKEMSPEAEDQLKRMLTYCTHPTNYDKNLDVIKEAYKMVSEISEHVKEYNESKKSSEDKKKMGTQLDLFDKQKEELVGNMKRNCKWKDTQHNDWAETHLRNFVSSLIQKNIGALNWLNVGVFSFQHRK